MSHKRKYDQAPYQQHEWSKKPRFENQVSQQKLQIIATVPVPQPPPKLPSISLEHEKDVFTHPNDRGSQSNSYDGLEYLGDGYMKSFAVRYVWDRHSSQPAGRMSQMSEILIRNDTISHYSQLYGLDKKLKGVSSQDVPPKRWTKIQGDVFEAYVGAVVISDPEQGPKIAEKWLRELWAPLLDQISTKFADDTHTVIPKVELAKHLLTNESRIEYLDERAPVIHKGQGVETFFVGVYFTGWGWERFLLGRGSGLKKADAGNKAAVAALQNKTLIDQILAKKEESLAKSKSQRAGQLRGKQ